MVTLLLLPCEMVTSYSSLFFILFINITVLGENVLFMYFKWISNSKSKHLMPLNILATHTIDVILMRRLHAALDINNFIFTSMCPHQQWIKSCDSQKAVQHKWWIDWILSPSSELCGNWHFMSHLKGAEFGIFI